VKNTLAVFQALVMQTGGETVDAFREALIGRLGNLAQTHSLLLQSNRRSADLEDLARKTLAAFGSQYQESVSFEGAKVELTSKQASGISLILHELATNAVKYGSLSNERGQVRMSWRLQEAVNPGCQVALLWQERERALR
jgi:two-component sensor histidine kinase